jgi:hypothetical protein
MEVVSYDTEKDKLVIGCPQIVIPNGLYEKYNEDGNGKVLIDNARLGLYTLAKIEQDKKEEAERRKALKAKKKKGGE